MEKDGDAVLSEQSPLKLTKRVGEVLDLGSLLISLGYLALIYSLVMLFNYTTARFVEPLFFYGLGNFGVMALTAGWTMGVGKIRDHEARRTALASRGAVCCWLLTTVHLAAIVELPAALRGLLPVFIAVLALFYLLTIFFLRASFPRQRLALVVRLANCVQSFLGCKLWLQVWLVILILSNMLCVAFLTTPDGRAAFIVHTCVFTWNSGIFLKYRGLSRYASLPHLVGWLPLSISQLISVASGSNSAPAWWLLLSSCTQLISLAFDVLELYRLATVGDAVPCKGTRKPLPAAGDADWLKLSGLRAAGCLLCFFSYTVVVMYMAALFSPGSLAFLSPHFTASALFPMACGGMLLTVLGMPLVWTRTDGTGVSNFVLLSAAAFAAAGLSWLNATALLQYSPATAGLLALHIVLTLLPLPLAFYLFLHALRQRNDYRGVKPALLGVWTSLKAMPLWVKAWLLLLVPGVMCCIVFPHLAVGRAAISAAIFIGIGNGGIIIVDAGLSKLTGFPHLLPWLPLLYWYYYLLATGALAGTAFVFVVISCVVLTISCLFDANDTVEWIRGNRAVVHSEQQPTTLVVAPKERQKRAAIPDDSVAAAAAADDDDAAAGKDAV